MAKKKRPKKNKTKKLIVATFETRKDQYANNIIADQQKYKLYDQYSLEEIEKELNKYNISITQKDIISKYEASYDINNIIKDYQMTYEEQLNNLYDLQILFDHECIMLYVHKTIEENYPVNEIPEYHYVIAALMQFLKLTEDKKLEYFLTLLKTMNKMSDFMINKKISFIFREIPTDIEAVLETCIAEDIHNCFPDLAMSQALS